MSTLSQVVSDGPARESRRTLAGDEGVKKRVENGRAEGDNQTWELDNKRAFSLTLVGNRRATLDRGRARGGFNECSGWVVIRLYRKRQDLCKECGHGVLSSRRRTRETASKGKCAKGPAKAEPSISCTDPKHPRRHQSGQLRTPPLSRILSFQTRVTTKDSLAKTSLFIHNTKTRYIHYFIAQTSRFNATLKRD